MSNSSYYYAGPGGFPTIRKAPDAKLDYTRDWTEWLNDDERIVTAVVTPAIGITLESTVTTPDGKQVTAWLSGGTAGEEYEILYAISTDQGRDDSRTIIIHVEQR